MKKNFIIFRKADIFCQERRKAHKKNFPVGLSNHHTILNYPALCNSVVEGIFLDKRDILLRFARLLV